MADKDNAVSDKQDENLLNYNSSNISPDWQFSSNNFTISSMGRIDSSNAMTVRKSNVLETFSCSTTINVDSSCPTMWDQLPGAQNLGFSYVNAHNGASMPDALGIRPIDVSWTPPNTMLKDGMFVQGADGFLPPSLAHIPADSGFIERAARYSCFSGGNFGDIANPFSIPESAYLEDIPQRGLKNEVNMGGSSNFVGLLGECEGSGHKNKKASEDTGRSIDEAKPHVSDTSNDSDEAEYSIPGGQEELKNVDRDASSKGIASKKRKRGTQDAELDQGRRSLEEPAGVVKHHTELQQKGKQIPASTSGKSGGKNAKQVPGALDKGEYIHVRAPRGQATNSHSLAERVRREKISERMKFLQDIVPGCSKVTGKAVMLDEIINYVQSLQCQIEFLSMKLATLNPQLDANLERLLAKDMLQSRGAPSLLAFPPIMPMGYPAVHQSQGLFQAGIQTLGNSQDALRRSMLSSLTAMGGGYKEHSSHVSSTWEDELNNVVHMGLSSTAPPSSQDLSGSLPPGPMKGEP